MYVHPGSYVLSRGYLQLFAIKSSVKWEIVEGKTSRVKMESEKQEEEKRGEMEGREGRFNNR